MQFGLMRVQLFVVLTQRRCDIEALEARVPQTLVRLWLIVYRTELTVSLRA